MSYELRDYQQECVDLIDSLEGGSHLVSLATGLGKTVTFSQIKKKGRVLLLSHRDELVHQPEKYYDCPFGVEQASETSNGEEVVSASVQSLVRRLDRFSPDAFDTIITDEAHHAAAPSYKKIYDYFNFRLHLGFTATPNRGDKVRLDDVYEDIIFERDLKWGIKNGYLTNIKCLQVDIGFDLSNVKKRMGDFEAEALADEMTKESVVLGVAKAYRELAVGQTIIFTPNVASAVAIASQIEGAVVVSGMTKNRAEIIESFTKREIPCIVNCMVFTEGTDIPLIETVIIARPTQNASLYTQMVGRGLRLYEGKDYLTLIDCVGATGKNKLCTAPSLLGVDASGVPQKKRYRMNNSMLTDLEGVVERLLDTPDVWIETTKGIDLFADENNINLKGLNFKKQYEGSLMLTIDGKIGRRVMLTSMNEICRTDVLYFKDRYTPPFTLAKNIPIQEAINRTRAWLEANCSYCKHLWDMDMVNQWGSDKASPAQRTFISSLLSRPEIQEKYNCEDYRMKRNLTKYEASIIIDRVTSDNNI